MRRPLFPARSAEAVLIPEGQAAVADEMAVPRDRFDGLAAARAEAVVLFMLAAAARAVARFVEPAGDVRRRRGSGVLGRNHFPDHG